ncbi:hypothetical protein [Phenylobacterium sp.]|uniref:hypothetical protein n=1 Tax=Phenylobacterium sp. TaxID=1871053 RepID=UPI002E32360B|nr:hypothetical protein [Phenylobacterium sp.]HEX3366670.1 hypothetical protein [Phenylobacterium sp.]
MAETYRSMRALERTASTSRVLNLAALAVKHAENPEHQAHPMFLAPALNAAVILKHRLRANEIATVSTRHRTATKLIVPFERSDLSLGGRSLFVGDRGWMESLQELAGDSFDLGRDAGVLEALDELPSLDPFLLREHMKRRGFEVAETHFEISPGDLATMQQFVGREIGRLIDLAYKGRTSSEANISRLVEALLSTRNDERLEPLRLTLRLEGESYREGIFAWKGFLYYKWVLNSLWPKLREVLVELMKVRTVGPRDFEHESLVRTLKVRLHDNIERQVKSVADYLRLYDGVFSELTRDGNATAFRDFLLRSPEMLVALGEGAGVVSHIASFWRFRFPKGKPLEANVSELLDILQDFESGLGGDAPAVMAA